MAKRITRVTRKTKHEEDFQLPEDHKHQRSGGDVKALKPLTIAQDKTIKAINANTLIILTGAAGTGKTYIAGAMAASYLLNVNTSSKLIITRPAIEVGAKMGFLPGELDEKYEPYLQPFRDVLQERLGTNHFNNLLHAKVIEPVPLGFMRGRTFKHCWVILDEAQNTTPQEMKMFLTRIGENCKIIINGDTSQKDIPGKSGLEDAIEKLSGINSYKHIHFTPNDVVRSGLVKEIIMRYEGISSEPNSRVSSLMGG